MKEKENAFFIKIILNTQLKNIYKNIKTKPNKSS